ncbi:hypothetical protein BVRB_035550 [Beta vulgaris subsp. vulgaris]|uniref:Uncharacterized protein n=1 Tax=Beta vulgaris subsp. vulgaris TaxID=3555 RepID=A0A0J7YPL7_BETVV|nr:hypothetical protein BVRB_035550 [Beta vulgaris subsp. vulgaris]
MKGGKRDIVPLLTWSRDETEAAGKGSCAAASRGNGGEARQRTTAAESGVRWWGTSSE